MAEIGQSLPYTAMNKGLYSPDIILASVASPELNCMKTAIKKHWQ